MNRNHQALPGCLWASLTSLAAVDKLKGFKLSRLWSGLLAHHSQIVMADGLSAKRAWQTARELQECHLPQPSVCLNAGLLLYDAMVSAELARLGP